jgi:hypothetical protein
VRHVLWRRDTALQSEEIKMTVRAQFLYSFSFFNLNRCRRRWLLLCLSLLPLAAAASQAQAAEYQAFDLTGSYTITSAQSACGGWQVGAGYPAVPGYVHALIWSGTAASMIDLHPASGYNDSQAFDMSASQEVGYGGRTSDSGRAHALLWTGTSNVPADLNPGLNKAISMANGTDGVHQVGWASWVVTGIPNDTTYTHAAIWSGSSGTYADINPSGFDKSYAQKVNGTQIVGYGYLAAGTNASHALLWTGTAHTPVDLNPAGFSASSAWGIVGTQQVGFGAGLATGGSNHALLWNGSFDSYIDLHPSGTMYSESKALGGWGAYQVGAAVLTIGGTAHAMLWNGSPDSYVDLQQFLPAGFRSSGATAMDDQGDIVGWANDAGGTSHAIIWEPVPEPATLSLMALGGLALVRRRRH